MPKDFQTLLKIMQQRRSIRRFRQEPVPLDLVERLMEAVRWAPSAGNQQKFRFIAVSRKETIDALADVVRQEIQKLNSSIRDDYRDEAARYLKNFSHFAQAPLLMVAIHRTGPNLLKFLCDHGATEDINGCDEVSCSVSAAIMNLLLAAHALGLGACWMTGPLIARGPMTDVLKVPSGWTISALLPVGYPDESPDPPKRRSVSQLLMHID